MAETSDPITEVELRKIDCDEEFMFAGASREERLARLRLLQRSITEKSIRIACIQRLELRTYELATQAEREKLRAHDAEYKTIPSLLEVTEGMKEEEKIIAQFIKMGKSRDWAVEYLKKQKVVG